jgi:hypothetical protein
MKSRDYITVERKTLEELISASSMECEVSIVPLIVSWFVDPRVHLARALQRMRAEIARVDGA